MNKIKKLLTVTAFLACLGAFGGAIGLSNVSLAVAERAVEIDYRLPLSVYTLAETEGDCQIINSRGELVTVSDGAFLLTEIGDYRVEQEGELIKIIRVFAEMPKAEFSLLGEMPTECVAGQSLLLPATTISSSVESVDAYKVEISFAGEVLAVWESVSQAVDYRFKKCGE